MGQLRTGKGKLPKTLKDYQDIIYPPFRGILFVRYLNDGSLFFLNGFKHIESFTNRLYDPIIDLDSNKRLRVDPPRLVPAWRRMFSLC